MELQWQARDEPASIFTVVKYYSWCTIISLHKQSFPADEIMHNPGLSKAACRAFAMERSWVDDGNWLI